MVDVNQKLAELNVLASKMGLPYDFELAWDVDGLCSDNRVNGVWLSNARPIEMLQLVTHEYGHYRLTETN